MQMPDWVKTMFDEDLVLQGDRRRLYVTLGQFSMVRLERDSQLLIPVYDYCLPDKECSCGSGGGGDLLQTQELEHAQGDRRVKAQAALVGSNGRVELDTVTTVDLDLALVVDPGNTEHDDALGLDEAL